MRKLHGAIVEYMGARFFEANLTDRLHGRRVFGDRVLKFECY